MMGIVYEPLSDRDLCVMAVEGRRSAFRGSRFSRGFLWSFRFRRLGRIRSVLLEPHSAACRRPFVEGLPCHIECEGSAVPTTSELTDEPAESGVVIDRGHGTHLRPGVVQRPFAIVVGKLQKRRIRDGSWNTPFRERLCNRAPAVTLAIESDMDDLLSERRVVQISSRLEPIDHIVGSGGVQPAGDQNTTCLGNRQRPHAQLLQQCPLGELGEVSVVRLGPCNRRRCDVARIDRGVRPIAPRRGPGSSIRRQRCGLRRRIGATESSGTDDPDAAEPKRGMTGASPSPRPQTERSDSSPSNLDIPHPDR